MCCCATEVDFFSCVASSQPEGSVTPNTQTDYDDVTHAVALIKVGQVFTHVCMYTLHRGHRMPRQCAYKTLTSMSPDFSRTTTPMFVLASYLKYWTSTCNV